MDAGDLQERAVVRRGRGAHRGRSVVVYGSPARAPVRPPRPAPWAAASPGAVSSELSASEQLFQFVAVGVRHRQAAQVDGAVFTAFGQCCEQAGHLGQHGMRHAGAHFGGAGRGV